MRHHEYPNVGYWYTDQDYNHIFEVVAADDHDQCVEIQYFAGEIEELDLETWYQLDLRRIPPPEDWSGPFEISKEDLGYSDDSIRPEDWSGPLSDIEPERLL